MVATSGSRPSGDSLKLPFFQLEQHKKHVPSKQHAVLQEVTATHVESFNFMLEHSLPASVGMLYPSFSEVDGRQLKFEIKNVGVGMPSVSTRNTGAVDRNYYPAECRERRTTYCAELSCDIVATLDDGDGEPQYVHTVRKGLGQVVLNILNTQY